VVADESYVRESIVNPGERMTEGFQPVMPAYQGLVSEEGLLALVEYIKSLSPGQPDAAAEGEGH
jgi:cytochrome c oxidase subunit 2